MSQNKTNDKRTNRKLSSCSVTITCSDYTQGNGQTLADNSMSGVEKSPVIQRNGLSAQDNQIRQCRGGPQQVINSPRGQRSENQKNRAMPLLDESPLAQQPKRNILKNRDFSDTRNGNTEALKQQGIGTRNETNRDLKEKCDDNTYAAILERFNQLKERMAQSSKKGDDFEKSKDCCNVLEEENPKFKRQGICPQDTERIMTTKVGGANSDYVKETVIERSTLTREGVLTTTRHIIEKCDKNGNIEYEIKESNRMSSQNQKISQCNNGTFDSGIDRSGIEKPGLNSRGSTRKAIGSKQENGPSCGENNYVLSNRCTSDKYYRDHPTKMTQNFEVPSLSQNRNRSRATPCTQISKQATPLTEESNNFDSRQQMREHITDNLEEESMPILVNSLNNTTEVHGLLQCCPCVCQLCAKKLERSLALPEKRFDTENLQGSVVEDGDKSRRVDYYLVGEILQKSAQAEGIVLTSNQGISYDYIDSACFDEQPVSSTALPRGAQRGNLENEGPCIIPNPQFYSSALDASRRSYPSERLQDISAPPYQSSIAYSSGNQCYSVEQLDNISAPSYHSSPYASSTKIDESEQICDVSPPTFQSDGNAQSRRRSYNEQLPGNTCENQQSEHMGKPSLRSPDTNGYMDENIQIPNEFNQDLQELSEKTSPKELNSRNFENGDKYRDENIADITPPFQTSSEECISPALEARSLQDNATNFDQPLGNDVVSSRQECSSFPNEDLQDISEPTGMLSLNNELENNTTLDMSRLDDETPPIGMQTNERSTSKRKTPKSRRSNISPKTNVHPNSRTERCAQVIRPVVVPVIYSCPGACECTNAQQNSNSRRSQICDSQPLRPSNANPFSPQYHCHNNEDSGSPRKRASKYENRRS